MIQSIRQSYDFKKFLKKSGGSGTEVIPNPEGVAQAYLDGVKIGDTKYLVQQVDRETGTVNDVLIKDPGRTVGNKYVNPKTLNIDLSAIAPEYDPEKNPASASVSAYPRGTKVTYNNNLYTANTDIEAEAGDWESAYWTKYSNWDETQTYAEDAIVVYDGVPYQCVVATATVGSFVSEEWNDVSASFEEYSAIHVYYRNISKVEYNDEFYIANNNYKGTGGVGPFTNIYWNETTVEQDITTAVNGVIKSKALVPAGSSITTDANGYLRFSMSVTGAVNILGIRASGNQPNTAAYFELVASSYAVANGDIIVKVTDNTGALLKNETLTCYMTNLLSVLYAGSGTISSVSQVVDQV